jgi:hypothetical protein
MEPQAAPAQVTTAAAVTSEATLVTEAIFEAPGEDREAVAVGEMIVAIEVESQNVIIGVQEMREHHRSVMTVAVIAIDGNEMRLSEGDDNHHLVEVARQATAVASPFGRLQQAKM